MKAKIPGSDHPRYPTLTPEERYLWERQFRRLTAEELAESRASTFEERLHQVDILNHIGRRLNFRWCTEEETEEVRQRWVKLKRKWAEKYGGPK